jgi:hypothetical protein
VQLSSRTFSARKDMQFLSTEFAVILSLQLGFHFEEKGVEGKGGA